MVRIEYIGKEYIECQMCSKPGTQAYLYNMSSLRKGFPEAKDLLHNMIICEKCAQRESGKKYWGKIKRNKI